MEQINVNDIARFMNLAGREKDLNGEQKQTLVMNALKIVTPPDTFQQYEEVIIFLIRALCSITKQDINLGINKGKFCFTKLCKY